MTDEPERTEDNFDMYPAIPDDTPYGAEREAVAQALGFPDRPDAFLDQIALELLEEMDANYAGINKLSKGHERQYFPGLAFRGEDGVGVIAPDDDDVRSMGPGEGFCGYVVTQREGRLLAIEDVNEYAPFASNAVVVNPDLEIRSYLGPGIRSKRPPYEGKLIGTIWCTWKQPQRLGRARRTYITVKAKEVGDYLDHLNAPAGQPQ